MEVTLNCNSLSFSKLARFLGGFLIVAVPLLVRAVAADAPRSIDGVLKYQFWISGFVPGAENGPAAEERVITLGLRVWPGQCVSFDCTRICAKGNQIALQIRAASLMRATRGGAWVPIRRPFVTDPGDWETVTLCPAGGDQIVDLQYRINKWDVGAALGMIDGRTRNSVTTQVLVCLDLYVYEKGKRVKAGELRSDPFFVRVSADRFEFSDAPFD